MAFVQSTIVEFQQSGAECVSDEILYCQKARLQAFYYELYNAYKVRERFVFKYIFYSLSQIGNPGKRQWIKQYRNLDPALSAIVPENLPNLQDEMGSKAPVLYFHLPINSKKRSSSDVKALSGKEVETKTLSLLSENGLPAPAHIFTDNANTAQGQQLTDLKKAAFICHKTKSLLLISHSEALLDQPLFYTIIQEYEFPVRSLDFNWLCRKNLRLMQAMALYKRI